VKLFGVAVAGAMLVGCASSPPLHYYTLTEVPAPSRLTVTEGQAPIRLDRVTIPTELDRSQIVRRLDSTQLQIMDNDRWAAPLDETIRRILSNDLATRLPAGAVANPNEPSVGEKRQSLTVDFSELYGDSACTVTLRAAWTLKQSENTLNGNEAVEASPAGGCKGTGSIPAAMSQALGKLSDQIAAAISGPGVRRAQ